jgi:hypothetical protein
VLLAGLADDDAELLRQAANEWTDYAEDRRGVFAHPRVRR